MSRARLQRTLRVVLGDQLSHSIAALRDIADGDVVLLAEVLDECTYVAHHAHKIVLVLSAMRHFAAELRARGVQVAYTTLDDPANTHSLRGETLRAATAHDAGRVVVTEPGEWRVLADMRTWHEGTGGDVEIRDDDRFLCTRQAFRAWAEGKRVLRMEFFYRAMRRHHDVLMEEGAPVGEQWNFDAENRKRLPAAIVPPDVPSVPPDATTRAVIALVAERFPSHMGDPKRFALPVTRAGALAALQDFVSARLPMFGDWQDAMRAGAPFLFHAVLSPALNLGLLSPREIIDSAEAAYRDGSAPLNAVEGFIRQILGWREFVRGIYWLKMPGYRDMNALGATRRMPWLFWSGETRMNCMAQAIGQTIAHAYAHHIQRLMITGNFSLIAGLHPDDVDAWYLAVYADAYEWVEMPNTRGMSQFADGGVVGSKPYAASGAYVNRMSDYCAGCAYDVGDATGPNACPFNFLYWDFIARHADRFAGNQRMAMPLRNLQRMPPARLAAIRARAEDFLARMEAGELV
jgi:deoxyribodipyrimidine photolyase-related protein